MRAWSSKRLFSAVPRTSKDRHAFHCCPGKCLIIIVWFVVLLRFVGCLDLHKNKLYSDS